MTASPALTLITLSLHEAIRIASTPGTKAPVYRPAVQDAVNLTRKAFREYEACCWREDLAKSIKPPRPFTMDPEPTRNATYGTPGHWTGD